MESIRKIYKIGLGPSSSHTMGPRIAAEKFRQRNELAKSIRITLYGSLAATGKGHLTDKVLRESFPEDKVRIIWEKDTILPQHPNGMKFEALDDKGKLLDDWVVFSVGGGDIEDSEIKAQKVKIYPHSKMTDILKWCQQNGRTLWEYVELHEGEEIWEFLADIWKTMKASVVLGLENEGVLPGILHLPRKASSYYIKAKSSAGTLQKRALLFAYALAVSEENAGGGTIVTAPTCGSCGVVPAVLYHIQNTYAFSDLKILRALATAALIGNLVKKNASISGAEVGCQGEVGTACAMAAGAAAQLFGGTPSQVEYAAEMGLEHHLGLTCDPVAGLVQIPCIERNAIGAGRAMDASAYAVLSDGHHRVSFDKTCLAMKETGHDLPNIYKETSGGGLALLIK
ncbi:MAG: L-serine ammonia-lyase [Lentimicrobiaceae bacterium]|nr:L-serine ammonia-lyase [Lentimicrobiaceae bacterium]MCO5266281.1 L-serine ammonia-lyase [Lentimicrobium sp.]